MLQAPNDESQPWSRRRFESLPDQLVQSFAHRTTQKSSSLPSALGLELQDQMEMTQLEQPIVVDGQRFHSGKIVDDHGQNSGPDIGWKPGHHLFPFAHAFPTGKQYGIQEKSSIPQHGFTAVR